jgi:hypothetical protein
MFGGFGSDVVGGNNGIDKFVGGPDFDVCFVGGLEERLGCESVPHPIPGRRTVSPSETTTRREDS